MEEQKRITDPLRDKKNKEVRSDLQILKKDLGTVPLAPGRQFDLLLLLLNLLQNL